MPIAPAWRRISHADSIERLFRRSYLHNTSSYHYHYISAANHHDYFCETNYNYHFSAANHHDYISGSDDHIGAACYDDINSKHHNCSANNHNKHWQWRWWRRWQDNYVYDTNNSALYINDNLCYNYLYNKYCSR